jgi:hypothetical protein
MESGAEEKLATDWDQVRRNFAAAGGDKPADWPSHVKPMTMQALWLLGVDDQRQLYGDGGRIEVKHRFKLTTPQTAWAVIIGLATLIGRVGTGINEGFDFGCKVRFWSEGCRP